MVTYRLIGTGTTDAQGIARCNNNYVGTGKGEVDLIASTDNPIVEGSIQSGTYNVWDYLFYDKATDGEKNTNWTSSVPSVVTDPNGTTLSGTVSFLYTSNQVISGDFEATLYCSDVINGVRLGVLKADDSTTQCRFVLYNPRYVKIHRENGVCKIYASLDNENWAEVTYSDNTLTSEDCKFHFYSYTSGGTNRAIKYKDLKIWNL